MSTRVDESIMNGSTPTGLNGIPILINSVEKGTTEVKHLLCNECDVILECKICRNLFRSVPNFVIHKRSYCRNSAAEIGQSSASSSKVTTPTHEPLERPSSTESCPNFSDSNDLTNGSTPARFRTSSAAHENRTTSLATKRTFNFLRSLTKRMDAIIAEASNNPSNGDAPVLPMHFPNITKTVPFTTFDNGVQVIKNPLILETLPSKEPDRKEDSPTVIMVVPQDAASRMHSMELRRRRLAVPSSVVKEINKRDQSMYDRLATNCAQTCDLVFLQCLICKKTYKYLDTLAFHLTYQHNANDNAGGVLCLICGIGFPDIQNHLNSVHKSIAVKYEEETVLKKKSTSSAAAEVVDSVSFSSTSEMEPANKDDDAPKSIQMDEPEFISSVSFTASTICPRAVATEPKSLAAARNAKSANKDADQRSTSSTPTPSKSAAGLDRDDRPRSSTPDPTSMKKRGSTEKTKLPEKDADEANPEETGDSEEQPEVHLDDTKKDQDKPKPSSVDKRNVANTEEDEATKKFLKAKTSQQAGVSAEANKFVGRKRGPTPPTISAVANRTMRKRTLKSPYDAAEYANTWPKSRPRPIVSKLKPSTVSREDKEESKKPFEEAPAASQPEPEPKPESDPAEKGKAVDLAVKKKPSTSVAGKSAATGEKEKDDSDLNKSAECLPVIFTQEQKEAADKIICREKLTCLQCGASFSSLPNTERHCYGHLGFVRFKCVHCDASAFHRTDLRRHMKNECKELKGRIVTAADMNRLIVPICVENPGAVVVRDGSKGARPKAKKKEVLVSHAASTPRKKRRTKKCAVVEETTERSQADSPAHKKLRFDATTTLDETEDARAGSSNAEAEGENVSNGTPSCDPMILHQRDESERLIAMVQTMLELTRKQHLKRFPPGSKSPFGKTSRNNDDKSDGGSAERA